MAITPATLSVTVTEAITLENVSYGKSTAVTIASISYVDQRQLTVVAGSETNIVGFAAGVGKGQFVDAKVKFMRFTNLDTTNFVRLRFQITGAHTFDVKIEAGQSFYMFNQDLNVSETAGAFGAFTTLDDVIAQADTADCDFEYFIAATT